MYTCPMHSEVHKDKPGNCPKCGMKLIMKHEHQEMGFWEKLKMSMTMTMGMEHGGIAGREMAKLMEEDIRNKFWFSLILTIPTVYFSMIKMNPLLAGIFATPVFFYGGWLFLYSAYQALKTKTLNMSVLIAVGITAAYGFSIFLTFIGSSDSYYEAAAMLITFVLFGHWMEMKSRRGTTDALQALFNLVPPQARLWKDGQEKQVATSEVKLGDILILKPGDRVPVDGEIIDGETAIDESLVTGESIPVTKRVEDLVIGGSINTSGSVKFKATNVGEDTALAQIVKMVETAQNSKAPGQKLADRFAKYLVIVAVGGGLITFLVWFVILGQPLIVALSFAISTIVIACPDALGLATPTAVAVGTGLGAKHNILIKDAPTLEQVSQLQVVVLDKTGTLTEGKPQVTDVIAAKGFTEEEILKLDAAAEMKSGHPLSRAVLEEAQKRKLKIPEQVEKFKSITGHGVEAVVNKKHVLVGTMKLMADNQVDITPMRKKIERLLATGKTIMILAINGKAAGVVGAADTIKPHAKQAIEKMKQMGLEVAMITGDNKKTAEAIGKELGISQVFAEVLPSQKAEFIKKLQQGTIGDCDLELGASTRKVAMVGDGVNDAPALATADIGIAIGAGTDVAIETAKVVLMKSDPLDILRAIKLSHATVRKMKQNLAWASVYNLLAIPIAAGILYPKFGITLRPEVSALLMSISSIIVATNAVLLKRTEKELVTI